MSTNTELIQRWFKEVWCEPRRAEAIEEWMAPDAQLYGLGGYPRNAGQFGVGHVPCKTEFSHEFSHPAEDRPTWDCGRKVA